MTTDICPRPKTSVSRTVSETKPTVAPQTDVSPLSFNGASSRDFDDRILMDNSLKKWHFVYLAHFSEPKHVTTVLISFHAVL